MQQINVALDIYSIIISLILIVSLYLNGRLKEKRKFIFALMCASNIIMLLGDMTNWTCEGFSSPLNPFMLRAGTLLFYLSSIPLLLLFTKYVMLYLPKDFSTPLLLWRITIILGGIFALCCVLSLWNGMFFWIDEYNRYQRGKYFLISQLIPFLIYMINGIIIFTHSKQLGRREIIFLSSYIVCPLTAELLQMLNYGIALLGTAVTISLLLIYINIQLKSELRMVEQEAELAESQILLLLRQIQPHFLYNILSTIRQLCDSNPSQAKQAITDFSSFLRIHMVSLVNKEPIPFERELEYLKSYVSLEQQRFPDRLHVEYKILAVQFVIPPLTLQPIVENAVRHGVMKRELGGTIVISSDETENYYVITVVDDGVGFYDGQEAACDRPHVGIQNVKNRLRWLCNGTLSINSRPGEGTAVVVSLPKSKSENK